MFCPCFLVIFLVFLSFSSVCCFVCLVCFFMCFVCVIHGLYATIQHDTNIIIVALAQYSLEAT